MGAPMLATARIYFPYIVSGVLHKHFAYVKGLNSVAGAWFIQGRTGVGLQIPWEDAADGIGGALNALLPVTGAYGECILQQKSGLLWNPVATHTASALPNSNSYQPGAQLTVTLRTQGFYHLKIVVLESVEVPQQAKITSPTGGDAFMDTFLSRYTAVHAGANDPWNWQVSQDERFLMPEPFVSCTFGMNRKARKARGLA